LDYYGVNINSKKENVKKERSPRRVRAERGMEMEARGGGGRWYAGGMSTADNIKGLLLALSSSLFIGASFIIKKKGLKKAASSSSALRAGTLLVLAYHRLSIYLLIMTSFSFSHK
jgi:hypothetical protein